MGTVCYAALGKIFPKSDFFSVRYRLLVRVAQTLYAMKMGVAPLPHCKHRSSIVNICALVERERLTRVSLPYRGSANCNFREAPSFLT